MILTLKVSLSHYDVWQMLSIKTFEINKVKIFTKPLVKNIKGVNAVDDKADSNFFGLNVFSLIAEMLPVLKRNPATIGLVLCEHPIKCYQSSHRRR